LGLLSYLGINLARRARSYIFVEAKMISITYDRKRPPIGLTPMPKQKQEHPFTMVRVASNQEQA
jgi:hypothetical protein